VPAERVLAIDYGERRIGLAISDPVSGFVSGLPTIDRKKMRDRLAKEVARLVAEHRVERIVLGVPYSMDGTEGPAAGIVGRGVEHLFPKRPDGGDEILVRALQAFARLAPSML